MASNSKNKILQIWERQFSLALFMLRSFCSGGMVPFRMSSEQTTLWLSALSPSLPELKKIAMLLYAVIADLFD